MDLKRAVEGCRGMTGLLEKVSHAILLRSWKLLYSQFLTLEEELGGEAWS